LLLAKCTCIKTHSISSCNTFIYPITISCQSAISLLLHLC